MKLNWQGVTQPASKNYRCGYCGNYLVSEKGYTAQNAHSPSNPPAGFIYICHFCTNPTFFTHYGAQTPGVVFGDDVADIDEKSVADLYQEARKCTGVGAYTAAVLCCRKLLMHIAVSKGAAEKKTFIEYVEYLAANNYIPVDAKDWVDIIRLKSNEANHEVVIMEERDAKDLLSFIEMLLRIVFEFPANVRRRNAPPVVP
jgi:Domain of unknown function (DUF4145)